MTYNCFGIQLDRLFVPSLLESLITFGFPKETAVLIDKLCLLGRLALFRILLLSLAVIGRSGLLLLRWLVSVLIGVVPLKEGVHEVIKKSSKEASIVWRLLVGLVRIGSEARLPLLGEEMLLLLLLRLLIAEAQAHSEWSYPEKHLKTLLIKKI
jgi:hypothetical protein